MPLSIGQTSNNVQDIIKLRRNTIVLNGGVLDVNVPSAGNIIIKNGSESTADGPETEEGGVAIFFDGTRIRLINSSLEDNTISGVGIGGAVYVRNATIEVRVTKFRNNKAIGAGLETSGGAIGTFNSGSIVIRNSLFVDNVASRGGAIGSINHLGETSILQSTFSSNQACDVGGAIWNRHNLTIETSTFFQNTAGTGGGALYMQPLGSSEIVSVRRNTFVDNSSATRANTVFLALTSVMTTLAVQRVQAVILQHYS